MLILIKCGTMTQMHESDSYDTLKSIAFDTCFEYLQPGYQIVLQYRFNVPDQLTGGEKEIIACVNNQQSFEMFLRVWDEMIKPHQIRRQDHILPVLEIAQMLPAVIPPTDRGVRTVPAPAPTAPTATVPATGVMKAGRQKSAPPPSDGVAPLLNTSSSSSSVQHPTGPTSHDIAVSLLSSFKKSDLPDAVPSIRAIMRSGETSAVIPFDPYTRPDVSRLLSDCKNALIPKLRLSAAEESALRARDFALSASLGGITTEIDIEDNTDIETLCAAIKRAGNDYDCFLVVDVKSVDGELDPPLPQSVIVTSLLVLDRDVFEVNLCRTPKREKDRKKAGGQGDGGLTCAGLFYLL